MQRNPHVMVLLAAALLGTAAKITDSNRDHSERIRAKRQRKMAKRAREAKHG
jgi:hypothetical protein